MAEPTIEVVAGVSMDASDACTQTFGMISAKKGGKTYLAGRFFEEFYRVGAPFIAFDPVGKFSALTLAADGESPGLNIPVIGGFRGDVSLDVELAARLAEYLIDNGLSAVVDVSQLWPEERSEYAGVFFRQVFETSKRVQRPHMIGCDEVQLIIPQTMTRKSLPALAAFGDIVKVGRNFGLGSMMLTQRPESVNKDILNQIECMFVGGLRGPQERKTIQGWVMHQQVDVKEQLAALPSLKPGEFFLWSPSWLELFRKVEGLRKWTYDSSATPRLGAGKLGPATKSKRDVVAFVTGLEALGKKTAAVPAGMEAQAEAIVRKLEIREEELAEHRRRFTELVTENEQLRRRLERTEVELVRLRDLVGTATQAAARELTSGVQRALETLGSGLDVGERASEPPSGETGGARVAAREQLRGPFDVERRRSKAPDERAVTGVVTSRGETAVLEVLAREGRAMSKNKLAFLSGYSPGGGGFNNILGRLRSNGAIRGSKSIELTSAGLRQAPRVETLPKGKGLLDYWLGHSKLDGCMKRIVGELAASGRLSKDDLGRRTGYSSTAGGFNNALGRLRTLGIVVGRGRDPIGLSEDFRDAVR